MQRIWRLELQSEAVPPVNSVQVFLSMTYQKYAAIFGVSVLNVIRSVMVIRSALKRLIENVLLRLVTSLE